MKRFLRIAMAAMLCLSMTVTAFAGNLGEITEMSDTVVPDGENGSITTTVAGKTDQEGKLALPAYKDAELLSAVAAKGTLTAPPEKTATGASKYLVAQFAEKEAEVELTLAWSQTETYKLGKAKVKDTAPGGLKAASYSMTNTAPVKIASYRLDMAVPQGYELSSIVNYDPEEDFDIYLQDGVKYGHYTFGELGVGGKAKLTLNLSESGGSLVLIAWLFAILVSAFFLYKNRGMLAQARELDAKRKAGGR